jgi:hypothetical protein
MTERRQEAWLQNARRRSRPRLVIGISVPGSRIEATSSPVVAPESGVPLPTAKPLAPPPPKASRKPPPRQPYAYWGEAQRIAMRWFDEHGYPNAGDGHYAELVKHIRQCLSDCDHHPGKSTVYRHVKNWIDECRRRLGVVN